MVVDLVPDYKRINSISNYYVKTGADRIITPGEPNPFPSHCPKGKVEEIFKFCGHRNIIRTLPLCTHLAHLTLDKHPITSPGTSSESLTWVPKPTGGWGPRPWDDNCSHLSSVHSWLEHLDSPHENWVKKTSVVVKKTKARFDSHHYFLPNYSVNLYSQRLDLLTPFWILVHG